MLVAQSILVGAILFERDNRILFLRVGAFLVEPGLLSVVCPPKETTGASTVAAGAGAGHVGLSVLVYYCCAHRYCNPCFISNSALAPLCGGCTL
jgi:hypothetical protein